jgi:DNA-binding transcriptional MerR regulator
MRIGELAARSGVSRRLLRYYEEQGLLRPVRNPNGYRVYAEDDVTAVGHIRVLLAAGLPTAKIAQVLDCVHDDGDRVVPTACPTVIDHLRTERRRIAKSISQLQASQHLIDRLLTAALTAD